MEGCSEIRYDKPRRKDRTVSDEAWIRDALRRAPYGMLATVAPDGPELVPNLFAFDGDETALYLHSARVGHSRSIIEADPRVAFGVAEMGALLPAEAARNFSVEYSSVLIKGRAEIVEDPVEATRALSLLMIKYAPHLESGKDYRAIEAKDLPGTTVFRIRIESWSAKRKTSDAADAYPYRPSGQEF